MSDWVQRHLSGQTDPEQFAEACQIVRRMRNVLRDVLNTHKSEGQQAQAVRLRAAGVMIDYEEGPQQ